MNIDDKNTIIKNYMIIRAILGETGIFAQLAKEYPYIERLFSLVLDEKLNLPFQNRTREQRIDAWQNWSNVILYGNITCERVFELWTKWANENEILSFSHEQRLLLQTNGKKTKDYDELKKMENDEKCNVIYTIVYFSDLTGIAVNILNGIEPLNLGVSIDKQFIDKNLKDIVAINLRNDERRRDGIRGKLPYGERYKMILENPLGIDFSKLEKSIVSGLKKPVQDIDKKIMDAYSLNGIIKMICLNYGDFYLDTSKYYIPDEWDNLLEIDKRRKYKICFKHIYIEVNLDNSIASVIKDIEERDLGYLRSMKLSVKKDKESKH